MQHKIGQQKTSGRVRGLDDGPFYILQCCAECKNETYIFKWAVFRLNFNKEQRVVASPELWDVVHHSCPHLDDRLKLVDVALKKTGIDEKRFLYIFRPMLENLR